MPANTILNHPQALRAFVKGPMYFTALSGQMFASIMLPPITLIDLHSDVTGVVVAYNMGLQAFAH